MADAVQSSCAAPLFKRPRLEFSPCDGESLISFESASSEERFSIDSGLQEDAYEATSSEDCPAQPPNPHPESQTLVFDQCTESGFVPQSAAGVLHQEAPEQEDDDDGDSSIMRICRSPKQNI
ncbi:uncharacterized protein LOC129220751 [Uloborus diversus]|uniref:uncharacterized protein LOC129220751 n=1 Tax=Uloborus diversus TaxID=327109 RepID=UPI00240A8F18|nr:uncharacterized protein LOC129220751 [Uloborus diversus]